MRNPVQERIKCLFDFFSSLSALLLFSPILLIVSLLVLVKMGRPIFFTQTRIGKDNQEFKIYKFRTMLTESPDKKSDAARLTSFGKFLRSTSLDELPGLWNVLRGDMSLVGPRPLLVEYLPLYNKTQIRRHDMLPGITGWAQVNGRNAISWDEKFKLDVWYIDNQSFWLDFKILLLTVRKVFVRDGISADDQATVEYFKGNDK